METSILNNYKKASIAWKNAINLARKKSKEEKSFIELAKEIENKIIEEDCEIAFPVNLSINEEAAHYTPNWKEENDRFLKKSDVLKIDIGTHYKGYICDGAITINLDNSCAKQIEANELALNNAISVANFNSTPSKIGKEIENTLKEKGFNPIFNLGGHGLDKFEIHTSPSIPNHSNSSKEKLEECVVAIEPFSSTGRGHVSEAALVEIFDLGEGNVRNPHARKLIETAKKYKGLPFAERWLKKDSGLSDFQFNLGLRELLKANCFETFPGLRETKGNIVTQVEKSLIILENDVIILGE